MHVRTRNLFARTIATHWSRHIPGNPNIVPQNVPGALSLQVANNIFSVAPRDGLKDETANDGGVSSSAAAIRRATSPGAGG